MMPQKKNSKPYHIPTEIGETKNAAEANLFAIVGIILTSIAATQVVAIMTHSFGRPAFSGFNAIYGWIAWTSKNLHFGSSFIPTKHTATLTPFGRHVVWNMTATLIIGGLTTLVGYVVMNRIFAPTANADVSQMVDSARMATIEDYRKAGFLSSD